MVFRFLFRSFGFFFIFQWLYACSDSQFDLLYSEGGLTGEWTGCTQILPSGGVTEGRIFSGDTVQRTLDYIVTDTDPFSAQTCGAADFTDVTVSRISSSKSDFLGFRNVDIYPFKFLKIPRTSEAVNFFQNDTSNACLRALDWQIGIETDVSECIDEFLPGFLNHYFYYTYVIVGNLLGESNFVDSPELRSGELSIVMQRVSPQ